jgi:hypothetical protein
MSEDIVDKIVNALLYEGYMLYPYRPSSLKNKYRWNFGLVYPEGVTPSQMVTECLLEGAEPRLRIQVRFLHVLERNSRHEVVERRINLEDAGTHPFQFEGIRGDVQIARELVQQGLEKVQVRITNRTPRHIGGDDLLQSLISTNTILKVFDGEWISLSDPPDEFRAVAASCRNEGTWPVLVGRPPERSCMLSSPIILYDYPRVADESPIDLFDSTEIDEILTLRILTLTDAEKEEMRRSGERERRLLEYVESLTPEQRMKLHGTVRDIRSGLKRGDRVRIRPKTGGDVFDLALVNRIGIVESIELDFDNRTHVAVVIEDDPGRDLGLMRQPGHRFFFSRDELELIA